eukprot:scaffold371040_cov50-Prasinocladus_malaysianus.AAC.1
MKETDAEMSIRVHSHYGILGEFGRTAREKLRMCTACIEAIIMTCHVPEAVAFILILELRKIKRTMLKGGATPFSECRTQLHCQPGKSVAKPEWTDSPHKPGCAQQQSKGRMRTSFNVKSSTAFVRLSKYWYITMHTTILGMAKHGLRATWRLRVETLQEVLHLSPLPALTDLQLQGNPIAYIAGYRQQVAMNIPQLIKLDKEGLAPERQM